MQAKLVVVGGEAEATEIELELPAVIGRGKEADLTLPHPLVSRHHCELFGDDDGRLIVRDLGSMNGTFVENIRVTEAELPPGSLLTVGAVTFRAIYGTMDDTAFPDSVVDETKVQTTQRTVRLTSADLPKKPTEAAGGDDSTEPNGTDDMDGDTGESQKS